MNFPGSLWPLLISTQQPSNDKTAILTEMANQSTAWWAVFSLALLVPFLLWILSLTTRLGVIASATFKEAVRQPLFPLLLAVSAVLLVVLTFLPYFSFGEDVKMLKDCGHLTLLFCGLLLAAWTASTSIADEIEGKTAMTLLSKPINRYQFVLGKYLGILQAAWLLIGVLGLLFLFLIYYKVGYDMKEASTPPPPMYVLTQLSWLPFQIPMFEDVRLASTVQALPMLIMMALEVAVLAAISVAVSTRLPMIVNLTICFTVFVIGSLTNVLVTSEATGRGLAVVRFVAQLIATVLPTLGAFDPQTIVAADRLMPPDYLGFLALYSFAYASAAILMACILFEDRDLA